FRIADQHRYDMRGAWHHRQAHIVEDRFHPRRTVLMAFAFPTRRFQMADCCGSRSTYGRRQCRRENKAGRVGPHRVDQFVACGDVPAQATEGFSHRPFDDVNAMHGVVALADSTTVQPIHADGMDLIAVGHGPIALGEIADRMHPRNAAIHGIETHEYDQLWSARIGSSEQLFEVAEIIVTPDLLFATRLSYALDHGIVFEWVAH